MIHIIAFGYCLNVGDISHEIHFDVVVVSLLPPFRIKKVFEMNWKPQSTTPGATATATATIRTISVIPQFCACLLYTSPSPRD